MLREYLSQLFIHFLKLMLLYELLLIPIFLVPGVVGSECEREKDEEDVTQIEMMPFVDYHKVGEAKVYEKGDSG